MKTLTVKIKLADPDHKKNPIDPFHGIIICSDPAGNQFKSEVDHDSDLSAALHLVKTLNENMEGILAGYKEPKKEEKPGKKGK